MNTIANAVSTTAANSNLAGIDFERETGWTFADALDMAVESRRDDRLFGNRNSNRSRRVSRKVAAAAVSLEESIGWGPGALVDFIAENQREERLFGKAPLYV